MILLLDICSNANSDILKILLFIKKIMDIAFILIPIFLIVFIIFDLIKSLTYSGSVSILNQDKLSYEMSKGAKMAIKRISSAIILFFIPTIVNVIITTLNNSDIEVDLCFNNLTKETIAYKEEEEALLKEIEEEKQQALLKKQIDDSIKQETEKNNSNQIYTPITESDSNNTESDSNNTESDSNNNESDKTIIQSDSSNNVNLTDITTYDIASVDMSIENIGCVYYATGIGPTNYALVNSQIATQFVDIMKNICNYVTTEATWLGRIEQAGAWINKVNGGYHGMGLAVDLNTWYTYTDPTTNITYNPYTCYTMQGENCWNNYKKFICEVCDGNTNCKYNVNYIIYKRYFQSSGWCWGGNWTIKGFDPIHYELSRDCSTEITKIDCN